MILNGTRLHRWHKLTISYEDIVRQVGKDDIPVTYRLQSSGQTGTLTPGDLIHVSADLIINAVVTGAA